LGFFPTKSTIFFKNYETERLQNEIFEPFCTLKAHSGNDDDNDNKDSLRSGDNDNDDDPR